MSRDHIFLSKAVLASYPAFQYSRWLGSSHKLLIRVQIAIATFFAFVLLTSAHLDRTLDMPGNAVGILEHPGIFVYLLAQCVIPYATLRGIASLLELPKTAQGVLSSRMLARHLAPYLDWFQDTLLMRNRFGKVSYRILTLIGFSAFAWNCYQNQLPFKFLGFDFWDSAHHPFGYWSTRVYKFYVAVFLAPAIVHVQIALVLAVRRILLHAAKNGDLRLEPYHPDGCGGVRVFVDSVIGPMVPVLLIASMMTFAAFFVHKKYDLTTMGGLALTCSLFIMIYLVPAVTLRKAIIVEKKRQLSDVAKRQGKFYSILMLSEPSEVPVRDTVGDLSCLSEVCKQISLVPNWPQLSRTVKLVSLAGSSPLLGWAGQRLSSYATSLLGTMGLTI